MYFSFAGFFLNLTLCMTTKLMVLVLCFPYFRDNSNIIAQFAVAGKKV
jgi:hypothetical protein